MILIFFNLNLICVFALTWFKENLHEILSDMVEMCICIDMVKRKSKWILFGRKKTNIFIGMTLHAGLLAVSHEL